MRYKIDISYNNKENMTIYVVWSGPSLSNKTIYKKRGNMLQLSKLSEHEMFICELREGTKYEKS